MIATIYAMATGKITRCVSALQEDVLAMTGDGQNWLEGESDRQLHYVVDGEILERPAPEMWPGGPAPYTLDMESGEVVTVTNEGGEIFVSDDPAAPFTLTEQGTYLVRRELPFPARTVEDYVEVTDA